MRPGAVPIFNAGVSGRQVRFTEAQQREMRSLVTRRRSRMRFAKSPTADRLPQDREQRAQQELLVQALRETDRLSNLRYRGGLDSYLQVLDAERNLFQGELTLARLRQRELDAIGEPANRALSAVVGAEATLPGTRWWSSAGKV